MGKGNKFEEERNKWVQVTDLGKERKDWTQLTGLVRERNGHKLSL